MTRYYGLRGKPFEGETHNGYLLRITVDDYHRIKTMYAVDAMTLHELTDLTDQWLGETIREPWWVYPVDESLTVDEGL